MTETEQKRPLFRPEAVEHHLRGRATTRQLDLRERRTTWVFRGLLVALAVGVLLAATIRVDNVITTAAAVGPDGRTVVVALSREPSEVVVGVEVQGQPVGTRIDLDGKRVVMLLDESFPPGTVVRATVESGESSILDLLLGWD